MGLISIHNAAIIVENGADMVLNNYLVWALFLPLGTSWSVDAIRKSLKKNPDHDPNDLNEIVSPIKTKIFHLGYLACLMQLSMIYFHNHMNKTGSMWVDGTAIHYKDGKVHSAISFFKDANVYEVKCVDDQINYEKLKSISIDTIGVGLNIDFGGNTTKNLITLTAVRPPSRFGTIKRTNFFINDKYLLNKE